jgi:RecA-family ATPase
MRPGDAALRYAQAGFRVFPVKPGGKAPLTPRGCHDASSEESRVRAWWERWPTANIGLALDGLVAIDIDPRNGGDIDALPQLPETCYARTGGGGWHYLYRAANGAHYPGRLGPGIDLKHGAGSCIVVEPSVHESGGRYCWVDETEPWGMRPAEAPEWLSKVNSAGHEPTQGAPDAELRERIRRGEALHDSLTALAARLVGRGMAPADVQAVLLGLLDESAAHQETPQRWQERRSEIPRIVSSAANKFRDSRERREEAQPEAAWPEPMNLLALADIEPSPPRMIIDDWLPCGYAALLAGHGGVGKSGIALGLAACIALGRPWWGVQTTQRRALYLSCEDRTGVLHWRLARIGRHLGITLRDLHGHLEVLDLVGRDSVLWERDPRTGYTLTAAFGRLRERMHGVELLVVDGVSDTYGGNENARSEVKRYVNALVSLIPPDTGAVLLVGHIAKPAAFNAQTTEGYSGSTSWHNSSRSRWYLYPETAQVEAGARPERTGDLILELQKANLGRIDRALRFAWDSSAHLFVGREIVGATALDRAHRDRVEQRGILEALKGCADADVPVPAALQGPRTAYLVLSQRREFPDTLRGGGREKTYRFRHHIEALRQSRRVTESSIKRSNRHVVATLVLSTEERA